MYIVVYNYRVMQCSVWCMFCRGVDTDLWRHLATISL